MELLWGADAILEMLIESLLTEFKLEIFIALVVFVFMILGIVLMALISIVALLVVPPIYIYYAWMFIKNIFVKFKKTISK